MDLLLTISSEDYDKFQSEFVAAGGSSGVLRDRSAHDPNLYSGTVHQLLVNAAELSSAPSVSAVIIAYIRSRRVHLTAHDPKTGKSIEYDGPESAIAEVRKLVEPGEPGQLS